MGDVNEILCDTKMFNPAENIFFKRPINSIYFPTHGWGKLSQSIKKAFKNACFSHLVVDPEHVQDLDADLDNVDRLREGQLELGVGGREAELLVGRVLAVVVGPGHDGGRRGTLLAPLPVLPKLGRVHHDAGHVVGVGADDAAQVGAEGASVRRAELKSGKRNIFFNIKSFV